MQRTLLRLSAPFARNHLNSPINIRHRRSCLWLVPLIEAPTRSRLVFFSSESNSGRNSDRANELGPRSSMYEEDVSSEELKKKIQSFMDDEDEEALPTIFEAILKRKLSGKHEESDNELMEELRKNPINVGSDFEVDDLESDVETDSDSDSD